jgi:hypothetical protein
MEETLEGGRGPLWAVAPIETEREREITGSAFKLSLSASYDSQTEIFVYFHQESIQDYVRNNFSNKRV